MTLDRFRESLDGTVITKLDSALMGRVVITMHASIHDGQAQHLGFQVMDAGEIIYSGQSFSTATRRYWEIVHNS